MVRPPQEADRLVEEFREARDPELREANRRERLRQEQCEAWRLEDARRLAAAHVEHEARMRERRAQLTRPWTTEDIRALTKAIESSRGAYRNAAEKRGALAEWATEAEAWLSAQLAALPVLLADHRNAIAAAGAASDALDVTRSREPTREARAAVLRAHAIDAAGVEPYWPSRQLQAPDVAILFRAALRLLVALREDQWAGSPEWRETLGRL